MPRVPVPEPVDAFLRGVHPAVIASVRTTPLICGSQASVAIRMRIQAARALVSTRGDDRRSVSAQVMISNRPSSCSASAVQLSTQSPQFM